MKSRLLLVAAFCSGCSPDWEPVDIGGTGAIIDVPTHVARDRVFAVTVTTYGGCEDEASAVATSTEELAIVEPLVAHGSCSHDAGYTLKHEAKLSFATPGEKRIIIRGVRTTYTGGKKPFDLEYAVRVAE